MHNRGQNSFYHSLATTPHGQTGMKNYEHASLTLSSLKRTVNIKQLHIDSWPFKIQRELDIYFKTMDLGKLV